jgi:misacylated tRNA(Ala) deacylase
MTEQLYLLDCYSKEFEAKILSVGDDGTSIILDKTLFYPNSGGQPNDTGTIVSSDKKSYRVIDVIKINQEIIHKIDVSGLKEGSTIKGIIDWERRYILMRYHTASHILATIIYTATGAEITGNQLYIDKARIDFSLEDFNRTLMNSFEDKANAIINKHIDINFRILNRDEAFAIPSLVKLRKSLPESMTNVRVVDIANEIIDFDHQACGGTHLKNTSEIGTLEIFNLENKGKDRRRIYFRLN